MMDSMIIYIVIFFCVMCSLSLFIFITIYINKFFKWLFNKALGSHRLDNNKENT